MKKICSLLLAAMLTLSLCTVSFGTEAQDKKTLPTNEQISSMDKILPLLDKGSTEEVSQAMLDAMKSYDFSDKLLVLAQIAEYVDENDEDPEALISFLPYIGDDLKSGLTQEIAAEIITGDYGDTFKIYAIDFASSQGMTRNSSGFESELKEIIGNSAQSEELRTYAANCLRSTDTETVALLEGLYKDSADIDNKMLTLKHIEKLDEELARVIATEFLADSAIHEPRHITMANKAFIRSINGEEELIDEAIEMNKEFISTGDNSIINGCLYTLAELDSPKTIEVVYNLVNFEEQRAIYTFIDNRFDDVVEYLADKDIAELSRTINAVPIKRFTPIINSMLLQRSNTAEDIATLNELLNVIENVNSQNLSRANPKGVIAYLGFRDGVAFPGPLSEWHAGLIWVTESSGSIVNFIHQAGNGDVRKGYYDEFMDYPQKPSNVYKGTYRKTTNANTLFQIETVAESLLDEAIGYTFTSKIDFGSAGTDLIIEPADIIRLRCDGVTEYVYSYCGVNIQSPNMKYVSGAQSHNNGCTTTYTPSKQASAMTKVS